MRTVLALFLVGCGGYEGSGGIALGIDAPGAALVVLQDGDQPFRQVPLDELGSAVVSVREGAYGVGVFCPVRVASGHQARFVFDTEAGVVFSPCGTGADTPFVTISGTTTPGAEAWLGQASVNLADPTGAYEGVAAAQETIDVVAIQRGATPRMLIQRVDGTRDRVVDLPVAADGADMVAVTPTVTNARPGEYLVSSDLNTPSTYVLITESDLATVLVPPPSVLVETDRPAIAVGAGNCFVQHPVSTIIPAFRIPSPFAVTLDRTGVAWTADPDVPWEGARLRLTTTSMLGSTKPRVSLSYQATASWRAAMGGDALPIIDPATDVPGWTPELGTFDAGEEMTASFSVAMGTFDGELTSCSERTTLVW